MKKIKKIIVALVAVAIINTSVGTIAKAFDPDPLRSSIPTYTKLK